MANKNSYSGCVIIIIGFILGTIVFRQFYTDKVWERALNVPVEYMPITSSVGLWLVICIGCCWLLINIISKLKK